MVKTILLICVLLCWAVSVKAQSLGQVGLPKYTATGLQYSWLTPSGGPKVFGIDAGGNVTLSTISGGDWSTLTGKPSTFPPSAHNQAISTITGLQDELTARLVVGGALGTPASGNLTNCTNFPANNLTGTLDLARFPSQITGRLGFAATDGVQRDSSLSPSSLSFSDNDSGMLILIETPNTGNSVFLEWPSLSGTLLTTNSSLPAANLTGTVASARLGTGTANSSTYLRGDGTWAAVSGGVTSVTGTANQITVTGTTTPVLSLPATITGLTSVTSTTFVGALTGTASGNLPLTGGTLTGGLINNTNGAASAPVVRLTGTIFTGGTGTTTKPTFLIEPTGTTSTGWSTTGTMLAANAPSGFLGKILDLQINGSSKASCDWNGDFIATYIRANGFVQSQGNIWLRGLNVNMDAASSGVLLLSNVNINDFNRIQLGGATSSYPAIKRSSNTVAIRLADDSADAGLTASSIVASGAVTVGSGTSMAKLKHGTATLTAGTVTVSDSNVVAGSRIFTDRQTDGGTPGDSYTVTITPGTSFTITSKTANATVTGDTSTVSYLIINP